MTRLEKLLMRIEMIDKVTAPANKIMGVMNKLTTQTALGFANITGGTTGMWGVGVAIQGMTNDYREFHKELQSVKTLGVADETLQKLGRSALAFSIKYGESAASFVNSSYEVQSAIAGLSGDELIKFTEAGNILAKGAKADAATITNYMGTMYGIFQNTADKMGRSQWVEMLVGQTSMAVDIFKSDGMQMSAAFTSLGADAQAHGIAINEQMAVLGQLQATMSGSEAGTKYKAFLRGVGAAQKALGLQFTDSAGRMLPVSTILEKLQGKFGSIDTVAKSDALKKAFGSDEAVATIKLLMQNTGGLSDAINELGKVKGMDHARWKALQLADAQDRLNQASTAVKIGYGALLTQALLPLYELSIENLSVLSTWIDKYPHLFGLLAKLTVWVGIVVAAVSALAIAKGMAMIAMVGLSTGLSILKLALLPLSPILKAARLAWVMFNFQLAVGTKVLPAAAIALRVFRNTLIFSAKAAWGFATALLANPITWIVVGVVALISGLVLLVKNWDAVKASAVGAINWITQKWTAFRSAIEQTTILKFLFTPLFATVDVISFLIANISKIPELLTAIGSAIYSTVVTAIDWVSQRWQSFMAMIQGNPVLSTLFFPLTLAVGAVDVLITALEKIPEWFTNFKEWLSNLNPFEIIQGIDNVLVGALNLIPGVNIEKKHPAAAKLAEPAPIQVPAVTNVAQPAPVKVPVVTNVAQPAPVKVPAVTNVAQPAPVKVPAVLQVAEPANLPAIKQPLAVVPPAVANVEKMDAAIARDREQIAPRPDAPVRNVPQGGLLQQINNSNTQNNKANHIENLNIHTTQKVDGYSFKDQFLMSAG